ncbi:hypothetical protein ACOKM3_14000 [Streptomyces sp. BH106]|uniref:hypothetical protein n=1 Tax=Streptomyces sp. BH106 TaxID=3410409 RepID=UPI003CF27432
MHIADSPYAAPSGGDIDPDFLWWVALGVGVLLLLNLLIAVATRLKRKKVPAEQLREELRREIQSGVPNVRGHIRADPSRYPGISAAEAEAIADAEGFVRQTHGAKGRWLFLRRDRKSEPAADLPSWERAPVDDVQARREKLLVRGTLCAVPGVPIAIWLTLTWLSGGPSVKSSADVCFYVVAHVVGLIFLTGTFVSFKRYFKAPQYRRR